MHHHYKDIRERIEQQPLWFDEHGVPRYCDFAPNRVANIYAREVVLFEVMCQACERRFAVAESWSRSDEYLHSRSRPTAILSAGDPLEYGDPPNVECCPAGPTMYSVPRRVLQVWVSASSTAPNAWTRLPALERDMRCRWWDDDDD